MENLKKKIQGRLDIVNIAIEHREILPIANPELMKGIKFGLESVLKMISEESEMMLKNLPKKLELFVGKTEQRYKKQGVNYLVVADLNVKEIAKLIRADIKTEIHLNKITNKKYSVTIYRYSMGQSIDIVAKGIEKMDWLEIQEVLKQIHDSYNFDDSDSMTDHFHVNYYGSIIREAV